MIDPAADKKQPDQSFFYRIQTGTPGITRSVESYLAVAP